MGTYGSVAGKNEAGILNSRSRPEASFSRGRIAVNLCEATRRVIRFSYKGLIGTIRCSVFRKFRCFFLLFFFDYLRGSVDRGSIVVFGLYIGDRRDKVWHARVQNCCVLYWCNCGQFQSPFWDTDVSLFFFFKWGLKMASWNDPRTVRGPLKKKLRGILF